MNFEYSTLAGLKSLAKEIQRRRGIPHHRALDLAAEQGGYACFSDARRKLPTGQAAHFPVNVRQNWWGYESREGGTAEISLSLHSPLAELVRPHHLVGYLGACSLKRGNVVERSGQQRHANETQWYIGRIARALQFMDATGLKPSRARKGYPTHDFDSRPPVADHDHCWYDPVARVHLLSTEPYPGKRERNAAAQSDWEHRHGWTTIYSDWGGIYGNRTEFILCCPNAYADNLAHKIEALEQSSTAVRDEEVAIAVWGETKAKEDA